MIREMKLLSELEAKMYPRSYSIESSNLELVRRSGDEDVWAIQRADTRSVYDARIKRFVYEPSPSNRTDEFTKDTRFTLLEAKILIAEGIEE